MAVFSDRASIDRIFFTVFNHENRQQGVNTSPADTNLLRSPAQLWPRASMPRPVAERRRMPRYLQNDIDRAQLFSPSARSEAIRVITRARDIGQSADLRKTGHGPSDRCRLSSQSHLGRAC